MEDDDIDTAGCTSVQKSNENSAMTTQELVIEYVGVPIIQDVTPNLETNVEKLIFDQISKQIGEIYKTTLSFNELYEEMAFDLSDNEQHKLSVVKMPGDGSCLFHSITHQLFGHKACSVQHQKASKQLRQEVVKHIKAHFSSYESELKGRVYETVNEDKIEDMNSECLFILNNCLPDNSFYGGSETLKAVCDMHHVNILVFMEENTCYFSSVFNEIYDRTLILAYRSNAMEGNEKIYNHYDSVCDISSNEILNSLNFLSSKLKNRNTVFEQTL